MAAPFDTTHSPTHGSREVLQAGIRCVTAPNTGPMTFTGTRSYIVGQGDVAVIDPGPAMPGHLEALLAALGPGERVSHIILTHTHVDHSAGVPMFREMTGAPCYAFGPSGTGRSAMMEALAASGADLGGGEGIDRDVVPDQLVADGEVIAGEGWELRAVHTPGHMSNHLCFVSDEADAVFSGDHLMGWATTLVSPPDGDLTAFMASLDRIAEEAEGRRFYPGHGAPVEAPADLIRYIRGHRKSREAQIVEALRSEPMTAAEITKQVYSDVDPAMHPIAERNVFAHLLHLLARGEVAHEGPLSPNARFSISAR